ncbi:hypothetical protein [Pseudomonas aeruginosa]|uniref:hypothetical protein n=1 Tax=Pseudomonas aeruginosa TaxID=287 RepID=UPI001CC19172|nr:hypothetical protein [Pseudomonas aeruginosa]
MMENRNGTTETACPKCGGSGHADSGGVQSWGEPISIPCDCLTEQEEFLAWANEEYEVEEGYELNESNPAVMENKKGWMARAALPKRSKFRQHLDERDLQGAQGERECGHTACKSLGEHHPFCKFVSDQDRAALSQPSPLIVPAPELDFSRPLETANGEPVKWIGADVIEYKSALVCVAKNTGIVYSSPYIGLKIRNVRPEQVDGDRPDVVAYQAADAEGGTCLSIREDFFGYTVTGKEPLMTIAQHERIVEALRFKRQQMDRAFTACINERDAALAEVERLIGVCASLDSEMRDMENKRDAIIAMRDAALARVAELEKPDPDYTQHPQIVGYARKKELEPLLDPCQPDGSHIYIGLDHPSLWAEEPPYEFLTPLYTAPVAKAQHSVPDGWRDMLAELQWHYEPYDDHYHRDQGFYCPVCGGEKDEGHKQGCSLAKLLATVPSDDQHSVPEEFSFEYRHLNGECHTVTVSREQVINEMPDFLFEALCSKFCNCEPVGETNVVECCCDEYAEEFKLIAAAPGKEVGHE